MNQREKENSLRTHPNNNLFASRHFFHNFRLSEKPSAEKQLIKNQI
jgi:hypothetical protein